jgi:lysine 2,3-aminomutase
VSVLSLNSKFKIQNSKLTDTPWQAQLAASLTRPEQLAEHFDIDAGSLRTVTERYPMRITPHYLGLIEAPGDSIWRQCVPDVNELVADGLLDDPLNETAFTPTPAVVHRYPDRALLLVSGQCAGFCRFCTRKSRVGLPSLCFSDVQLQSGIDYLASAPGVRDVILTGGDPLLLDDDRLADILGLLRRIPHIEIIRIGSRVPVTLPDRITPDLCRLLAQSHPLYLNTHFNHPRELTPESAAACERLAAAGIQLGNQTVLLRGVNDDLQTMLALNRGLLAMRVRPYYLHQMDQARGTAHFKVPVERGLEIISGLRGKISGMGIPHYVEDPPDGSGKKIVLSAQDSGLSQNSSGD